MSNGLDGYSFFAGFVAGMMIKWTDIVPILGGVVLGLSINKFPDFVNLETIPYITKTVFERLTSLTTKENGGSDDNN